MILLNTPSESPFVLLRLLVHLRHAGFDADISMNDGVTLTVKKRRDSSRRIIQTR
jgi:hypothetical protein